MAFTARHNITTVLTQNLVAAGDNAGDIKSVHLANIHASDSVNVDLIINNRGVDHYIIKNVAIPSGTALVVDTSEIVINTTSGQDSLRIKLSAAVPVDVIINNRK